MQFLEEFPIKAIFRMQTQRPLGTLRVVSGLVSALDDSFGDIVFLCKLFCVTIEL